MNRHDFFQRVKRSPSIQSRVDGLSFPRRIPADAAKFGPVHMIEIILLKSEIESDKAWI